MCGEFLGGGDLELLEALVEDVAGVLFEVFLGDEGELLWWVALA